MNKIWRCTVCGYLHEGDSPPEFCPVCHADASKFVLVSEEPEADQQLSKTPGLLREMYEFVIPHAVCAHFPSALIPVMVLFLGLYLLCGRESFELTAFYLLVVTGVLILPTFATGIYDWRTLFAGERAPIFRKKIALATTLTALSAVALLWRWQSPQLMPTGGRGAWLYLLLIAAMLVCVVLLGHFGGMLRSARDERKNN